MTPAAALLLSLAAASPLAPYRDHDRVLVVAAPRADDPALQRQDDALAREAEDLAARDLVVIRAVGDLAQDGRGRSLDAQAVRAAAHLPAGGFGVALIGKDGGVKLVRREPVAPKALFETIDAMPMRQAEMKRAR